MNTIITATILSFFAMLLSGILSADTDSDNAKNIFKASAILFIIFALWLSTYA